MNGSNSTSAQRGAPVPGAVPLVLPERRQGVYILLHRRTVRYVGATGNVRERLAALRPRMSFTSGFFLPVRGSRKRLFSVESDVIRKLRPTHNRLWNPRPRIKRSVTSDFGFEFRWVVWLPRNLGEGVRTYAKRERMRPEDFVRMAIEAGLRGRGWRSGPLDASIKNRRVF